MKEAQVEQADLVTVQPLPIQSSPTPMSILARAVELGRPVEELAKLMDLQERWERREAEKAFVSALAAFKANPPTLEKNKPVDFDTSKGKVKYKYVTLDQVTTVVGGRLAAFGLSMRWKTAQVDGKIRVTCILQHAQGHSEETSLEAPPDNTGAKNEIQAMGSTVAYLQRYTGLPMVGLAAADDTDGITFTKVEEMMNSILSAVDLDELQERFNKAYKRAHVARDKNAAAIAIEAKDRRKAELTGKTVPKSQPVPESPAAKAKFDEFQGLCEKKGLNEANRHMLLGKHENIDAAIAELKGLPDPPNGAQGEPEPASLSAHETKAEPARKGRAKKAEAPGAKAPETSAAAAVAPASSAAPKEPEWGF